MRKLTLLITSLFLSLGTAWAQTNSNGALVTFTNVQKSGKEFVLYITEEGKLEFSENSVAELGDAAKFRATKQSDGGWTFYNESKCLYMIWRGNSGGYNDNAGVLKDYDATYCNWTVTSTDNTKSGTFRFAAKRGDKNENGTLVIMGNEKRFDKFSDNTGWATNYSNLYRIDAIEDAVVDYVLTDSESGKSFEGTCVYPGVPGLHDSLTLPWSGSLVEKAWAGNTFTATVGFPFEVGKETMIAIHEKELKHRWYVSDGVIKVKKTPFEYSDIKDWAWVVEPAITGNVITFTIKHTKSEKYVAADGTAGHDSNSTVALSTTATPFEVVGYGGYPCFKVSEKEAYLSINSDVDDNVKLGQYGNTHNGTRIHFAPVPVAMIGDVEYNTLGDALSALNDGETLVITSDITPGANEFIELNGKKNITITAAQGVVINGDIQVGYHPSHVDAADRSASTFTVDGLTVNGTLTVCSNDAALVVSDTKAAQITVKTYREGMDIALNGNTADGEMGTAANSYGMFLVPNETGYNLTVDGNTFKNINSHAFVVQGCGDGSAETAANSIVVKNNTFESWGTGGKSNRAAFKIWADTKYAPVESGLEGTTNAMRELVAEIAASNNTYSSTADNTVEFDAYGAAGDAADFPAPMYPVAMIGTQGYATFADALSAAQAGDEIDLCDNVTVTSKLIIDKAVTIDGNGYSILADANTVWYTVSGKLNIKSYKVYASITANATLKNITFDANSAAGGITVDGANVVLDNFAIKNLKADAVTLNNDANVVVKTRFAVDGCNSTFIDARNGVVTVAEGTFFDMTKFTGNVSPATSDLKGAVDAEGNPFFCAYGSTTYYKTLTSTSYSNLTLLADVEFAKDVTLSGTLNLNGHNLTVAEGKVLKVSGTLAIAGDGELNAAIVLTNLTATLTTDRTDIAVTTSVGDTRVVYEDGAYKVVTAYVAQIGAQGYTTLQAAIDAAQAGETVVVLEDIELAETVTVAAGKEITLDLNGKTVSQVKECTEHYNMILNKGNLTITGEGKLSFKDTGAGDPNYGWGSYTLYNMGTLVVENGTVEHLGEQAFATHCILAIFQYSGSTTINGGTISTPNYRSVRLWKGDMTINGGTFDGQVWVQAVDDTSDLAINGGTFGPNGRDGSSVFVGNVDSQGKLHKVEFAVTDGTFTTKIGCSNAAEIEGDGIKGGKFTEAAKNNTNSALLAEGFVFAGEALDGYYGIEEKVELPEVEVNDIKGSLKDSDPDLTFALNFKIKDADKLTQEYLDKLFAQYGDWYTDYVLTISGLTQESVTFNANGDADGYLAGQYDAYSENWVSVPFENVTLADGESIYIMDYAAKLMGKDGLRFTLAEVAEIVQNFDCGVFFTPEFLAANPGMKVDLQLVVFTEDEQGVKTFYNNGPVASNSFDVADIAAVVSGENMQSQYYATLEAAVEAAQAGETVVVIKDVEVVSGTTITLDNVNLSTLDGVTLTNNGVVNVKGEVSLNIVALVGEELNLLDGAIVNGSTVGGSAFVAGGVTFRGANTFAMLYDYGTLTDYYGTTAPMKWIVEEGASVTLTDKARYGLGYGDNVTVNGNIENALAARETVTEADRSLFVHGLVAQESTGWNRNSAMTVKDAYVVIGSNNSFGNKPGNYGGTYTFNFENSVVDASRITFYEALSTTTFTFDGCDVKMGTFMTRDADSKFTLKNSKVLSTTPSNGNDEGNYNKGELTLVSSSLTYSAELKHEAGVINLDCNSVLTAPSISGAGKITVDATGLEGSVTVINGNMANFTGTIEIVGNEYAKYEITAEGLVINSSYIAELEIIDGEYGDYTNDCDKTVGKLTYVRTFPAAGIWYPVFLPFDVPVASLAENFDVARINDLHTDFSEEDGSIEKMWVEYIVRKSGTLAAGKPFLVRAKSSDVLDMVIELEEVTLYASDKKSAITVSSAITKATFEGVYEVTSGLVSTPSTRYMAVNANGVWDEFDGYALNPFRVLMTLEILDEEYYVASAASLSVGARVIGEENEDGTTTIYDVEADREENDMIFDLQGRRVLETEKGGIYIKNGKKFIVK